MALESEPMSAEFRRRTVANAVAIEGNGLHSGIYTTIEIRPAEAGDGISFLRKDLGNLEIPVRQESTTALDHATSVGLDDVSVGTIEHLLSAVQVFGITDACLVIDGPEVPIVDGSALPFIHLIEAAGVRDLPQTVAPLRVNQPVVLETGDRYIRLDPADQLSISYTIDFPHPAIGVQSIDWTAGDANAFARDIAPARTFGFLSEVEKLRAVGLARGGSVDNCIVLDEDTVTNGPLRFRDEFVRHKIVDLLGDLVLLGRPLVGRITAFKAGHALHSRFVEAILRASESIVPSKRESDRDQTAV